MNPAVCSQSKHCMLGCLARHWGSTSAQITNSYNPFKVSRLRRGYFSWCIHCKLFVREAKHIFVTVSLFFNWFMFILLLNEWNFQRRQLRTLILGNQTGLFCLLLYKHLFRCTIVLKEFKLFLELNKQTSQWP